MNQREIYITEFDLARLRDVQTLVSAPGHGTGSTWRVWSMNLIAPMSWILRPFPMM